MNWALKSDTALASYRPLRLYNNNNNNKPLLCVMHVFVIFQVKRDKIRNYSKTFFFPGYFYALTKVIRFTSC